MVITSLYGKYFQKSRAFLFPILGIKKTNKFLPMGTYISIDDEINTDEMKLICVYKYSDTQEYIDFEKELLLSNSYFERVIKFDIYRIYIFDLSLYEIDWFNFLGGKYSNLSKDLKNIIKKYYGENTMEYAYIKSFLYPQGYYEIYAELLDVRSSILINTKELCDPFNLSQETLKLLPKKTNRKLNNLKK